MTTTQVCVGMPTIQNIDLSAFDAKYRGVVTRIYESSTISDSYFSWLHPVWFMLSIGVCMSRWIFLLVAPDLTTRLY